MPATLLLCLVVGVADGDTLTARCGTEGQYEQVRVRIAGIDAPESRQAFGQVSKDSLVALCFQQEAKLTDKGKDRYRRMIADVECQGTDVGQHQVATGNAWVYDQYAKGYSHLYALQSGAQTEKLGLWRDLGTNAPPIAPWEWRKSKRK